MPVITELLSEALKFIRRRARLEGATAQDGRARFPHRMRRGQQLLLALDRARARHDLKPGAADDHAVAQGDRGVGRVRLAADELEALLDGRDAFDLRPRCELLEVLVGALVANRADDRARDAAHHVRAIAELADFRQHGGFLPAADAGLEDDDHGCFPMARPGCDTKAAGGSPAAGRGWGSCQCSPKRRCAGRKKNPPDSPRQKLNRLRPFIAGTVADGARCVNRRVRRRLTRGFEGP